MVGHFKKGRRSPWGLCARGGEKEEARKERIMGTTIKLEFDFHAAKKEAKYKEESKKKKKRNNHERGHVE